MSYGLFTDKQTQPSLDEINEALSTVQEEWTSLLEFLRSHYRSQEDLKFLYGSDYGWAFRFRNKGKLLAALFPNRDHFIALVILNGEQLSAVRSLKLHSSARTAIESANLYAEGKWLFVRVSGLDDVRDVENVIELKARKPKASTGRQLRSRYVRSSE
jgi:hypothetical protein